MKMVTDCLKVLVNTLLDNCDLANAPVNILIDDQLYDVKEFYFDNEISEYVMVLTKGYKVKNNIEEET